MDPQVLGQFAVRMLVGQLDRAPEVAEERDVDEGRRDGRLQPGRRKRDAAALAAAEQDDPLGIHRVVGAGRVDRKDGVGEDAPVEMRAWIQDAPGQEARVRWAGTLRLDIAGRARLAAFRALAAGVHDQVRVAARRPQESVVDEPSTIAIAQVLDDRGQWALPVARREEPATDWLPAVTAERDIPCVDRAQAGVHRFEERWDRAVAGVRQRLRPERVEVGRLVALGSVALEVSQRQVEQHLSSSDRSVVDSLEEMPPRARIPARGARS